VDAGLANLVDRHEPTPKPGLLELMGPDRTVEFLTQGRADSCRQPSLNIIQWSFPAFGCRAGSWFVRSLRR
jgi:hypothetical protein